jgi:anti-sigma28 factor (negative regulator of flagellin synthesis)
MDLLHQLVRAAAGGRARSAPAPKPDRLEELGRAIERGEYRVPPERLADALLQAMREGPAPRD